MSDKRTYPRSLRLQDRTIDLEPMTRADRDDLLDLAQDLPPHDLLFMRRQITRSEDLDTWLSEIDAGHVVTLLARDGEALVGYATVDRSRLPWSRHVAELRVVVRADRRGQGLGRALTQEAFALALSEGIEKMMARMTLDQKGAIAVFEGLGFRPEALLRDHVKDSQGVKHDLVVMSHDVQEFGTTLASYGVADALG
ncbi:MAG: GNAT family N-acetyltransferase [Acidobacteria bacterium]|nr:MAG: GNAT family N-acetyltransferase [Acidobacteriota bacterium]REK07264.1 MAG: GNAT family N-acetyltransferase [Acidobacteriota bacterium]